MSSEENNAIVRRWIEAYNEHHMLSFDEFAHARISPRSTRSSLYSPQSAFP